jgi:SAM-dependent methyltransferase/4-amino-4-deoxy-L-arabinose transferase-like glycosyltransferase
VSLLSCKHLETDRRILFAAHDYITGDRFELHRCSACGLVRTVPAPTNSQLSRYYPSGYYGEDKRYPRLMEWLLDRLYATRARSFARAAGCVPGRVIDIGCGRGQVLHQLRALGWQTAGTELSETSARYARDALGLDVKVGEVQDLNLEGPYDLVIIWHVLEHMSDPGQVLREVTRILAPSGTVIIGVPNFSSWEAALGKAGWFHLDVPRHLNHFTPTSLAHLMHDAGLQESECHFSAVEYDSFSFAQTLLNALGFRHNLLYDVLRSRGAKVLSPGPQRRTAESIMVVVLGACLLLISPLWIAMARALHRGATMTFYAHRVVKSSVTHAPNQAGTVESASDQVARSNSDPPRPGPSGPNLLRAPVNMESASPMTLVRSTRAHRLSALARLPGVGPLLAGVVAVTFAFIGQNILTPGGRPAPHPDITASARWYASGIVVLLLGWWGSYRNGSLLHYPSIRRWIPRIGPARLVLCGLAALSNLLSWLLLRNDWASRGGGILWLVSLVLLIMAFARETNEETTDRSPETEHPWRLPHGIELAAFAAIMLLAAIMRLWRLGDLSAGMHGDEGEAGLDALGILHGVNSDLFTRGWFNQPNMYYWSLVVFMKLFGSGLFGLRMFAVVCGLLTVAFTYLLGREMFGQRGAIIAGSFMAFQSADVLFSREEFSNTSTPALLAIAFYFALRGLRTRRHFDFVVSGLATAFNLYFYAGGRLASPMLLALFAYLTVFHPRFVKYYWSRVAAWAGGFAVMSMPFAAYFVAFPINGTQYPNDRFIWLNHAGLAAQYGSNAWTTIIWDQLQASLSVLTLHPDVSAMGALDYPITRPIEAAFIVIGLAWALWRILDTRFFVLSLWFWASIIAAGVLTIDAPNLPRLMAMLPVLPLVLAAVLDHGIAQLSKVLEHIRLPRVSSKTRWLASAVVASGIVAVAGIQNWQMYIDHYLNSHRDAIVSTQAAYVQQQGLKYRFYNMGDPILYWTYGDNHFINPRADGSSAGNPSAVLPFIDNGTLGRKSVNVLLWFPMYDYLSVLHSYYPAGMTHTIHIGDRQQPQQPLITFVVRQGQIDARRVLRVTYVDASGRRVMALSPALGLQSDTRIPVGLKYPITATWTGSLFAEGYARYRFRVNASAGTEFAIDGVSIFDMRRAQAERMVLLAHGLHTIELRITLRAPGTSVDVRWSTGSASLSRISRRYLWSGAIGRSWNGEVWSPSTAGHGSGVPLEQRIDGFLGFRNAGQLFVGPAPTTGRWSSTLTVSKPGTYGFQINVNGRVIMTADRHAVIDRVTPGLTPEKFTGHVFLGKGRHVLDVRVRWPGPFNYLELYWSPPGTGYRILVSPHLHPLHPGVWLQKPVSVAG